MKAIIFFITALTIWASNLYAQDAFLRADSLYKEAYSEYPKEEYLVGVGIVDNSGDRFRDRKVAEVRARLEIAKVIRVRVEEEIIDSVCEGKAESCMSEFRSISKETVDEFLAGSRIVKAGEGGNIVYAIAVKPRKEASEGMDKAIEETVKDTKENIEKAKGGDKDALKEAQEGYMKALVLSKGKEAIEGEKALKGRASDMLEEMEKEIEGIGK